MQGVLSPEQLMQGGSMSNLLQEDLSLEWFMQGVLSSGARVSVMQEYLSCKWFHIQTVTVRSCHARGSVTQVVLSCKGFCLWSSSILGPMQGVLSMQEVLSIWCKGFCHQS